MLAAVMFVDNHIGGSYYPAGSTLFLPGKLEKVIEENGGDMLLEREVVSILFEDEKPVGVLLDNSTEIKAPFLIYSGTVWNLFGKLIDSRYTTQRQRDWAKSMVPTYPSVVLYAVVDKKVIPADTAPIEMLVGNPEMLDESEVTAYILSIDDRTLCGEDEHTIVAIGPTFEEWKSLDNAAYQAKKKQEQERLVSVLEKRFPGFRNALRYAEVATPRTIERYTLKNGGTVAGPKQMLGQHMLKRLHTCTDWENLFCCGESTVLGTGTPTVTTEGLSAANAVLKKIGKDPFVFSEGMQNYVRIVPKPFTKDRLFSDYDEEERQVMLKAMRCRLCEQPTCVKDRSVDVRGIMRRVAVGNCVGAKKCWLEASADQEKLGQFENNCIWNLEGEESVHIQDVISYLVEVVA